MKNDLLEEVEKKTVNKNTRDSGMSKNKNDTRVHVSFPETLRVRLDEIKKNEEIGSVSEVFRNAVKFYLLAYEEHKKGSAMLIRHDDGSIEKLRMFL